MDTQTKKRTSLGTDNEDTAEQIVAAKNQAERQPALNLQIARAYATGFIPKLEAALDPVSHERTPVVGEAVETIRRHGWIARFNRLEMVAGQRASWRFQ